MKVGIALSGGVARGSVHIGVLSALTEAGISIDYVAGSSAGSLVGCLYCAGLLPDKILEIAQKIGWLQIARPIFPGRGFVTFAPLERTLTEILGPVQFDELSIPFAVVTADMNHGEPVIIRSGAVATAVRASSSVPGLVAPVEQDGMLLCDGGVVNNCPVDVVREMGADYVIAVDLFTPSRPKWGPIGMGAASIELMIRSSGGGIKSADCLITPDLAGKSYFSFSRLEEYVALGRQATEPLIEKIKADIHHTTIN